MIKTVFFDFDGVLTLDKDAGTSICKSIERIFNIPFEKSIKAYRDSNSWDLCKGKISLDEFWTRFYTNLKAQGLKIDFDKFRDSRQSIYLDLPIDSKMLEIAKEVKNLGYPIGIITDNNHERVGIIMKKIDFKLKFDHVLVSDEIKMTKETPELFFMVKEKYGNSIFIDNSQRNCENAAEAGIVSIYFDDSPRDYNVLRNNLKESGVKL